MNLTNGTSVQCIKAMINLSNFGYRSILMVEMILGTLAIVPNALILLVVWRTIVFPFNLRLLIGHLSFVFLWFSIGDIVKNLYLLLEDPCAYRISSRNCRIFDLATSWLVLPNLFYALIPICVERMYATLKYRIYDTLASRQIPWLAPILILSAWLTAGLINGSTLFTLSNDQYPPICDSSFMPPPNNLLATMIVYLSMETAAIFATAFIHFYNNHMATCMAINRAKYDLSARFQIDQNIQVSRMIIPSMILHLIFHLPTFSLNVIIQTPLSNMMSGEARSLLGRSTVLLRLIYAVVHPISAFYSNKHLKDHLSKTSFGKFLQFIGIRIEKEVVKKGTSSSNAVAHFTYLDQMWSNDKSQPKTTALSNGAKGNPM